MQPSYRRLVINDTPQPKLAPEPPPPSAIPDPTAATAAAAAQFDSSAMAVTVLVLISAIFFLGFFSIFARRLFSDNSSGSNLYSRSSRRFVPASAARGLEPSAVSALPLSRYTGGGAKEGAQWCVVCLSEFEEEETVKVIPGCGHVFHQHCIDAWLVARGSCPLCRCSEMAAWRNREVCLEVVVEREEEEDSEGEGGGDGGGGEGEGEGEEEVGLGVVAEMGIE